MNIHSFKVGDATFSLTEEQVLIVYALGDIQHPIGATTRNNTAVRYVRAVGIPLIENTLIVDYIFNYADLNTEGNICFNNVEAVTYMGFKQE